jgi:DNA-directed RNA polymerase subunit RPC12/RpoP
LNTCVYTLVDDDSNSWECSECREWWTLNAGSPEDNEMNFCPKCGSEIVESKIETVEELIEEIPETVPYFAISNAEIDEKPILGNTIKCKVCGEHHNVEYGDIIEKDGSKTPSKMLAFIKCPTNDKSYLVGINGKEI